MKKVVLALLIGFTMAGMARMLSMLSEYLLEPYLIKFANWL